MEELVSFIQSRQKINLTVVGINILVLFVLTLLGDPENVSFMLEHGAMYAPYVLEDHQYYRIVTSMFLHFGLQHLINNMLLLIFLGDLLERLAGKARYLIIFLGGGILGNILSLLWNVQRGRYQTVSAGASGAVFAAVGALVFIVIRNKGKIEGFSGKRLIFMAVLSILGGLTAADVDNLAHIGGFAGGFLLAALSGAGKRKPGRE